MKAHGSAMTCVACRVAEGNSFSASFKSASSKPLTVWNKCCGIAVITNSHQLLIGWYGETEGT